MTHADERLIVALDVPTLTEAEHIVQSLGTAANFYKIGYQLFPLGGYQFAKSLSDSGRKVFIDAKLFDIGATVERGVKSLTPLGADVLTVHADPDTVKGAVEGRADDPRLKIFAVTVLTSWDESTLSAHGLPGPVLDVVLRRAELAAQNGADGVIASAQEASAIRDRFDDQLEIITPGIRPKGSAANDQKRVVTPRGALEAGATRIVVGRPITAATDRALAANAIQAELQEIA